MNQFIQLLKRDNERHTRWLHAHPIKACIIAAALGYLTATCSWLFAQDTLCECRWIAATLLCAVFVIWQACYHVDSRKAVLWIIACLCAITAQADDYVQIMPASYTKTVRAEIDIGNWRHMWVLETERIERLSRGRLEIVHKVWWHPSYRVAYLGSKLGATPILESREVYSQEGDISYAPVGAQHIRHSPIGKGAYLSTTNNINAADMPPLPSWSPSFIGRLTEGEEMWRTETIGSYVECNGRNLANARRQVVFDCIGGGLPFSYEFEFAPNETKTISLGVVDANRRGAAAVPNRQPIPNFLIDFTNEDSIKDWPLP